MLDIIFKLWLVMYFITICFSVLAMFSTNNIMKYLDKDTNLSIIPFYNLLQLMEVVNLSKVFVILLILPVTNLIAIIMILYRLSIVFATSKTFTIGLILLPIVFLPILNFGINNREDSESNDKQDDRLLLTESEYNNINNEASNEKEDNSIYRGNAYEKQEKVPTFKAKRNNQGYGFTKKNIDNEKEIDLLKKQ